MKMNKWLVITAVIFAGLTTRSAFGDTKAAADVPPLLPPPSLTESAPIDTPPSQPAPAPAEVAAPESQNIPPVEQPVAAEKKTAKPAAKKKTAQKAAPKFTEVSQPLNPGPAVVTARRVNVRGKATMRSEVLGRLTNGEPVNVIAELRRDNKRPDDPDVWAQIELPAAIHGWVHGKYVDANKTVTAKKLNVRGGPGENFSIIGLLKKGDTVNQIGEKEGWLELEAAPGAYAFVAAAYLKQVAAEPPAPVEPEPVPTTVAEGDIIAPPATDVAAAPSAPTTDTESDATQAASPAIPSPDMPVVLDPSIRREVDREGVVRPTWSIQAPDDYRLVSPETGESIVYLHSTTTNLDLSRYKGLHIIATGEEGLDLRWKNTPVLTIRRIQVIE